MDEAFIDESEVFFQQRATGYADDAAILEALKTEPDVVVVSSSALAVSGGFGSDPDPVHARATPTATDRRKR